MVEINEDRCPGGGDPAPLRVWRVTNDQMGSDAPAVRVYNITFIADKLGDDRCCSGDGRQRFDSRENYGKRGRESKSESTTRTSGS